MCPNVDAVDIRDVATALADATPDGEEEGTPRPGTSRPELTPEPTRPDAPAEAEEEEEEDPIALAQSVDSFNGLEDGQPTPPGHLEYRLAAGWDHGFGKDFGYEAEPELEYTPKSPTAFLENLQVLGAVELEGGGTEFEPSMNLGWMQRWLADGGPDSWVPTIAGLTELNMPLVTGFTAGLPGDSVTETVTVAKIVGPGSAYLNGEITGMLGKEDDMRHLILGMRAGYKWVAVEDKVAVILDYDRLQSESLSGKDANVGELSLQWGVNDHLTLGPGISVGLDKNPETPRFGAGLMILVE
jgi:hypothetical protein